MNANSKKIAGIAATTILLALPATVAQADCAHALGWTANQNNVSQTAGPTLYGPAEPMIDKNIGIVLIGGVGIGLPVGIGIVAIGSHIDKKSKNKKTQI